MVRNDPLHSACANEVAVPYGGQTAFSASQVGDFPKTMWIRPYLSGPRQVVRVDRGKDGSLYLHPAAPNDGYFWGRSNFMADTAQLEIDFTHQLSAQQEPHISLHPSGASHVRRHVKGGAPITTDTVQSVPFAEASGEHVATVAATNLRGLGAGGPGPGASMVDKIDAMWEPPGGHNSFRLLFLLNATEPTFVLPCKEAWRVLDEDKKFVVYLGLAVFAPSSKVKDSDVMTHSISGFTERDDHLVWLVTK